MAQHAANQFAPVARERPANLAGMNTSTAPSIEIFRAGRHVDMAGREIEFTREDLAELASSYDPTVHEAPVVVGHPKTNAPAYGWVKRLTLDGDVLKAELGQLDPAFAELVEAGRYKKRSASFWLPKSRGNPTPGRLALKHVGFLGAVPPAVKGLKDVEFADGDEAVEFAMNDRRWGFRYAADLFRRVRDWMIEEKGLEKADAVLPSWQIEGLDDASQPDEQAAGPAFAESAAGAKAAGEAGEPDGNALAFAERERALAEREARLAEEERRLAEARAKAERDEAAAFADGLVSAGKLLPRDRAAVVELLLTVPGEPVSFADGDQTVEKPAAQLLREVLERLPLQVEFGERARPDGAAASVAFAAPSGALVPAEDLELLSRARAYQAEHKVPFIDAVRAIGG